MSTADSLHTLAFGAADSEAWGAAWFPAGGPGVLLVGLGAAAEALEAHLEEAGDGAWRVRCASGELVVAAASDPLELGADGGAPVGFEQLCEVTGELAVGGAPAAIGAPGRRGGRVGSTGLSGLDSVREVSAWFDADQSMSVLALRPRKRKGQDQDALSAAVIEPDGCPPITDPRLSTTYTADGRPARVGFELWSEDPESYPRRLAGESIGSRAAGEAGGWSVSAERLVCHSRGRDGTGVYLIARPA